MILEERTFDFGWILRLGEQGLQHAQAIYEQVK
jgi:hypothetical protein